MKQFFIFILTLALGLASCKKDETQLAGVLSFSTDTLIFDTVFSTIGSATRYVKVYNTSNQTIEISSIRMGKGTTSAFYFNADGEQGPLVKDLKIRKKDSLYVMMEVTVDPQNASTPMIVQDSLIFDINGVEQHVDLVAWGQDAYYHTANAYGAILDQNKDTFKFYYHSVSCNTTWTKDKPHVVYGYAIVESPCQLTIEEGTSVHFFKNSGLIIGNPFTGIEGATLKATGTASNPIYFKGTRLEYAYDKVPGQWDRIWFTVLSDDNSLAYTVIKNGNIGVQADSNINANPTVTISNCIIQNHAGIGLLAQGSYVEAYNTLIANAGQYLVALAFGGKYEFTHCTLANFWDYGSRDKPSLLISNYYEDASGNNIVRPLDQAHFINTIIYGTSEEEMALEEDNTAAFNVLFDHCLLKTKLNTSNASRFVDLVLNPADITVDGASKDAIFDDAKNQKFSLFEGSVAINKGKLTPLPIDITDKPRDAQPDLGAFEF